MAKFTQYYLQYKLDDLFAQQTKADRQKFFGALFEKDESIEFAVGEGEDRKVFKHKVYHLSLNKDIIVMRIANDTTKEVEQDFMQKSTRCKMMRHCLSLNVRQSLKPVWDKASSATNSLITGVVVPFQRSHILTS